MPIEIPQTALEVSDRSQTDIQRVLLESNPRLKNSWLLALETGFSNRIFDFYIQLEIAIQETFLDTASDENLDRLALIQGIIRLAATASSGFCVATGTEGSDIPLGTTLTASGNTYTVTESVTIAAQLLNIVSINRSGQTATVITLNNHGLANNVLITVLGADQSEYNVVDSLITVTGLTQFEYVVAGTPATPATGTITAEFMGVSVPILSDDFGAQVNLDSGEQLQLQSVLAGVDDVLVVDFGEIGGGVDQETDASLRDRTLDKIRNPVALFNDAAITAKAKEISGVTRVFVRGAGTVIDAILVSSITRVNNVATVTLSTAQVFNSGQVVAITGADQSEYNVPAARILVESDTVFHYIVVGTPTSPATGAVIESTVSVALGRVEVFFMRDNDEDPIPSASEVTVVKDNILTILPAATSPDDVLVFAPTPVLVDFTFSELTPTTSSMQAAIITNLQEFFEEDTEVGVNIDEDAYRSAIFNTVDSNGEVVKTFDLGAPIGDIIIDATEIGILNDVVFL